MNREQLEHTVKQLGDEVAVIVPYATFGTAIDLSLYNRLMQQGVPVVIDAASSFGTKTLEEATHFGKGFGGAVVFSFHATKSFGIGEGGLVYSMDQELIKRIRQAGNFGFSSNRESVIQGLNSKMSEYTAAIALATLDQFPPYRRIERRFMKCIFKNWTKKVYLNRAGPCINHKDLLFINLFPSSVQSPIATVK